MSDNSNKIITLDTLNINNEEIKKWVEEKIVGKADYLGTVSSLYYLGELPYMKDITAGDYCRWSYSGTDVMLDGESMHSGDILIAKKDMSSTNPGNTTSEYWDIIHTEDSSSSYNPINLENGDGSGSIESIDAEYEGDTVVFGDGTKGTVNGDMVPGAEAKGYQAAAFGGLRYDYYTSDDTHYGNLEIDSTSTVNWGRTPTSAEGNQSFAAGGSAHAIGDWSQAFGKDTKACQRGSFTVGGGNKSGLTQEQFNDKYTIVLDGVKYPKYISDYSSDSIGKKFGTNVFYTLDEEEAKSTGTLKYYSSNKGDVITQTKANAQNFVVVEDRQGLPYEKSWGFAFASGEVTSAVGRSSFSANYANKANGMFSAGFGNNNEVNGEGAFAIGKNNIVDGKYAFKAGEGGNSSGYCSAAFGQDTQSQGESSFALGIGGSASGRASFKAGDGGKATGYCSSTFGYFTQASGSSSLAGGTSSRATADGALAFGANAQATNKFAVALGYGVKATGENSFATNRSCTASALNGFAAGDGSLAKHQSASVFGEGNQSSAVRQTVVGRWNKDNASAAFIVGNGWWTGYGQGTNAFEVLWNGRVTAGADAVNSNELVRKGQMDKAIADATTSGGACYIEKEHNETTEATENTKILKSSSFKVLLDNQLYYFFYEQGGTKYPINMIIMPSACKQDVVKERTTSTTNVYLKEVSEDTKIKSITKSQEKVETISPSTSTNTIYTEGILAFSSYNDYSGMGHTNSISYFLSYLRDTYGDRLYYGTSSSSSLASGYIDIDINFIRNENNRISLSEQSFVGGAYYQTPVKRVVENYIIN